MHRPPAFADCLSPACWQAVPRGTPPPTGSCAPPPAPTLLKCCGSLNSVEQMARNMATRSSW
jgi:hypothetical protein